MPYPHSNSDGKATLGHDEKGMPTASLTELMYNHPAYKANWAKEMEAEVEKIKQQLLHNPWDGIPLEPKPGELGKPTGNVWNDFPKKPVDQYVHFKIHKGPKPDPVLIPATEKYTNLWHEPFHGMPPKPIPITTMGVKLKLDGVLPKKVIGHNWAINTHHDYTESEVRQMLMDGFSKMADMIIKEMKENKK